MCSIFHQETSTRISNKVVWVGTKQHGLVMKEPQMGPAELKRLRDRVSRALRLYLVKPFLIIIMTCHSELNQVQVSLSSTFPDGSNLFSQNCVGIFLGSCSFF